MRATALDVEIGVQIGAEGDINNLLVLFELLSGEVDGISILTDHITTDFLTELLKKACGLQNLSG